MQTAKFLITSPVRTAQTEEYKYALFNTRSFKCIYVGETSYKLWSFLSAKKELTAQEIVDFVITEFRIQGKTAEEVFNECKSFLDFLGENGFIREALA